MSKPMKNAAELVALLNAELRKQDACAGVSVEGVTPVADERVAYTWTAHRPPPFGWSCTRTMLTLLRRGGPPLQQQYDLASEELT
jgi:hypothetical protein